MPTCGFSLASYGIVAAMVSRVMKTVLFTAAVALVVGGISMVSGQRERARLASVLELETEQLSSAYRAMAEQHVFPSENSTELTQDQRQSAARVRAGHSRLSEELTLHDKVGAINDLQLALVSYLRHSMFSPSFVDSTATHSLQQALGERGSVVELLQAYNETAKAWNVLGESGFGRLQGRLGSQSADLLPYLRFDGNKEFYTVISL
jgi:hypothetical protein